MNKRDLVKLTLEVMGYKPMIDDDGDIVLRYQMKTIYVLGTQQEDTEYLVVMLPQFYEMHDGEEIKTLTVCNKLTRDVTLAKVFIDKTLKDVTACCEFYYCDEDCLEAQLKHSFEIIGQIRSIFYKTMGEMND